MKKAKANECWECKNKHPYGLMENLKGQLECPECGKIIKK
jgi:PHP family Zn ribbon phosphoesterase